MKTGSKYLGYSFARRLFALWAALLCLAAGCGPWPAPADLATVPQKVRSSGPGAAWKLPAADQARLSRQYLARHYEPWLAAKPKY